MPQISTCPDRYDHLAATDPTVYEILQKQIDQESFTLKLIASENFVSEAVLEANGSIFTNKYCEGYPGARYYEGNEFVDSLEELARSRLKKLFGVEHANVQPYSGSPANMAVYRALVKPGDKVMGLALPEGGHLTHGWNVNFSGTEYRRVPYGVDHNSGRIIYDQVREIAKTERPKLIWVGGTAYPRAFEYERFAEIADEVDAYLVADIAHVSGLILAGVHPDPAPYCDVISSTSHKTLRGPRGGFILSRIDDRYQHLYSQNSTMNLAKRLDRSVFPHLQGGPHMNNIAALAVALQEASTEEFRDYGRHIVRNAKALAEGLLSRGYQLVSGGTDNHMLILDLRERSYSGKEAAMALARGGLIANFNMVPGDWRKPFVTSGVRIGTAAVTSMGMRKSDMRTIANWIDVVLTNLGDQSRQLAVAGEVREFCRQFSIPGIRTTTGSD
jgi:glycine hydroxymethyltransferase